ncbi:MAG: ComEC/Rec2 family competence protein [Verrucomicrobiales bacterium]|nr:ComEC/Rec2 family competence protein [Verrucomicrobiales bacterium]
MPDSTIFSGISLVQRLRRAWRRLCQPLFLLGLAAVAGILAADFWQCLRTWHLAVLAIAAFWLAMRRRHFLSIGLLTVAVFAFAHRINDHSPLRKMIQSDRDQTVNAVVVGMVADEPEAEPSGAWRFPVQAERLDDHPSREKIYVRIRNATVPEYGDRIRLEGALREPDRPRNPGEFDFAEYLRRQGFGAEMSVAGRQFCQILDHGNGSSVMVAAISARRWIAAAVTQDLENDPQIAATIRAMVLGTREDTPQDVEDAFIASGTMHIFAVSGLHVALFGWVLRQFLRPFGISWRWMLLLIIPLMFFYVFVTGLRASAWRAALMTAVFLAAPLVDRKGDIFNTLGAASLLLLGWDTQQLFQPGFQLSFGVLLALALMTRWFMAPLAPLCTADPFLPQSLLTGWQRWSLWVRKKACESIAVSMACAVGSAPLMLHHFKLLSPIGIVANLFLVLFSSVILFVGCLSILCTACKAAWLAACANNANWLLAQVSIWTAKFFAAVPGGHVRVDIARLVDDSKCRITVLALPDGGGAAHLHCGRAHWMLDAGGGRSFLRTVRPHLLRYPVSKLDGLVLTHTDANHSGAAAQLAGTFSPGDIFIAPEPRPLLSGAVEMHAHATLALGSEASLKILHPPGALGWGLADNRCLVAKLDCQGRRFLFVSDAGFLTEKWLLETGADVQADVLIKGRHRSDHSGLGEFLTAVNPRAVVFSNASFPSGEQVPQSWKELLQRKGIVAFDQLETGAVEIAVGGDGTLELRGFANGQRLSVPP